VSFLRSVEVVASPSDLDAGHPFDVPAILAMASRHLVLRMHPALTVFVGDNGSGKSTSLEAIAIHQGLNAEGGARGMQFRSRDSNSVSRLHEHLRVLRSPRRPRDMFFLRSESYFNVATAIEGYGPESLALYGGSPHDRSHGESFIDLLVHRFGPHSLFLLDEPESALSIHGQLQFLVRMHDLIQQGSQFVIATHSPLLMAYPEASIYEFADDGPNLVDWASIDAVRITSDFLARPSHYLDELFDRADQS
jgi:predicted ATPase